MPLWQHVVIGEELIDLFVDEKGRPAVSQGPGAREDRRVNPAIERITSFSVPVESRGGAGGRGGGGRDYRGRKGTGGRHRPRGSGQHRPPHKRRGGHDGGQRGGGVPRPLRRPEVIALLDDAALLPAITFIFSRNGCEAAVRQCSQARLRLTDEAERRAIRAVLDERLAPIGVEDEDVLGLRAFRRAALDGYASHHAGMLPLLKTVVEELFAAGLIKAVFATETLALASTCRPARWCWRGW